MALKPALLMPDRVTQKDLAKITGLSQATISLALENHPRLSQKVRDRVQSLAKELGYNPDPYLSGLSAYRKRMRPAGFKATLAWLSNDPEGTSWRMISTFQHYYEGAKARAAELGYRLEEHPYCRLGMTAPRMERILRARNIPGVFFAPQPHPHMRLDLDISRFSAVTFGYTLAEPRVHVVANQHYRSVEILIDELLRLGYRRPGLALELEKDERVGRYWSAAFLRMQRDFPSKDRVPPLFRTRLDRSSFLVWYRRCRPDVVIALWEEVYPWLVDAGISVPDEVGLAQLSVRDEGRFYSGIWENPRLVGARAVELLVDLIHRGERGSPENLSYLLVEGTWKQGKTVRAVNCIT